MSKKMNKPKTKKKELYIEENNNPEVKNLYKNDDKESDNKDKKEEVKKDIKKNNSSSFSNFLLVLTIIIALLFFVFQLVRSTSIYSLLNSAIITVFAVIYLIVCISYRTKNKKIIVLSSLLLMSYFCINILTVPRVTTIRGEVIDFSKGTLKDAVVWANKNHIELIQEYEYSDIVPEYEIIYQSVKAGTKINDVDEITISISEGPNPYKEVVIPSMVTWDSERVINYIKANYLTNVIVEFVESDKLKNTVIEQSRSGSMLRNDEIKLVFSYGEEGIPSNVTLIDFTNKSRFEIEFFMKQNHLTYNIIEDFSNDIKKGYGMKQSVEPGEKVNTSDQKVDVTISKGPKIVIPDFHKMSIDEMMSWAIKNKLKLEFFDKYDDSIKEGKIISLDKEIGDVVEQGSSIKVTLSRGSLLMPKFNNADEFYAWADKYGIVYEVKHVFSDSVPAGEVIEYSHKKGDAIKNGESLSVTISDGTKAVVPNVIGLSKNQAATKLKNAGFNYNFVYRNSSTTKDQVLQQSFQAGSEVSSGTTITVTLSNGKGNEPAPIPYNPPSPQPSVEPTPTCESVNVYIYDELLSIGNASSTCSKIKGRYSSLKFVCNYVHDDGFPTGLVSNADSIDGNTYTTCDTITLNIVNND